MKLKSETIGTIEILLAFALAGSTVSVGKIVGNQLPVFLTTFLSLCFTMVVMLPLQLTKVAELKKLDGREILLMGLQALTGIVLFRIFSLYGLRFTGAAQGGLITSSTPVIMALAGVLFLKEKMTGRLLSALLLLIGGLAIVQSSQFRSGTQNNWLGNLLIVGAVFSEVAMTLLRKKSVAKASSITNTTVLTFTAMVLTLPLALADLHKSAPVHITGTQWLLLIYYGAVATALAYLLWGDGALRIPASKIGICMGTMPLTALILSAILNKETGCWLNWVGFATLFSAIFLVSVQNRRKTGGQNRDRSLQS